MPWKYPRSSATVRIQPDNLPMATTNSGHPGPVPIHPGCRRTHQALPSWDRALCMGSEDHYSCTAPRLLCYVVPYHVPARLSSAPPLNTFKVQQMFIWRNFQEKTAQNSVWLKSNVSIAEHPRQPSPPFQCVLAQLPLNSKSYDVKKKALIIVQISVIAPSIQSILTI